MQQQLFKTMQVKPQVMRTRHSSIPLELNSTPNVNLWFSQNQFKFTQHQAQRIQSKLPKEFYLLRNNLDDILLLQQQLKYDFNTRNPSSNKSELNFIKNEDKKNNVPNKLKINSQHKNHQVKNNSKINQTCQDNNKKQSVIIHKKKYINKNYSVHSSSQSEISQNDSQSESFQIKESKKIRDKEKQKGKIKQFKESKKLKQPPKQNFKQQTLTDKSPTFQNPHPFQNNLNQSLFANISSFTHQPQPPSQSIPNLQSSDPKHHSTMDIEHSQSKDINHLRYLFGLPYNQEIGEALPKLASPQKNFCLNILDKLQSTPFSHPFRSSMPPQTTGTSQYHQTVYNPINLQTIQKKIKNQQYHVIQEFHADINRIFLNSYKYYQRTAPEFQSAISFENCYQQLLKDAYENPEQYLKQLSTKPIKIPKQENNNEVVHSQNTPRRPKKKKDITKPLQQKSRMKKKKDLNKETQILQSVSQINNSFPPDNSISQDKSQNKNNKAKKIVSNPKGEPLPETGSHSAEIPHQVHHMSKKNLDSSSGDESQYENPFKTKTTRKQKKRKNVKDETIIKKEQHSPEEAGNDEKMNMDIQNNINDNEPNQIPVQHLNENIDDKLTPFNQNKFIIQMTANNQNRLLVTQMAKKPSKPQQLIIKQQKTEQKQHQKNRDKSIGNNVFYTIQQKGQKQQQLKNDQIKYEQKPKQLSQEQKPKQMPYEQKQQQIKNENMEDQFPPQNMRIQMNFYEGNGKYPPTNRNENYVEKYLEREYQLEHGEPIVNEQNDKENNMAINKQIKNEGSTNPIGQKETNATKNTNNTQNIFTIDQTTIVNNLQNYLPQNFDTIIQQPSSTGATITVPLGPQKSKIITKKKNKNKNNDPDYRCSDDSKEEQRYRRRKQKKKKKKGKEVIVRQNKYNGDVSSINHKKRGRHPKKVAETPPTLNCDIQNNTTIAHRPNRNSEPNGSLGEANANNPSQKLALNITQSNNPQTQQIPQMISQERSNINFQPALLSNPKSISHVESGINFFQ